MLIDDHWSPGVIQGLCPYRCPADPLVWACVDQDRTDVCILHIPVYEKTRIILLF